MNYEDINILVVYCERCGIDTGIGVRLTRREALKDLKYCCGKCGHEAFCDTAIIREENKEN